MSYWEAILLGIVQGLTEFLPISSTAHIVIASQLMGLEFPGLVFEIFLHQASALAVIFFLRNDLIKLAGGSFRYLMRRQPEDRAQFFFAIYIVVATVITGVLGILLLRIMDDGIRSPAVVSVSLFATGCFLVFIERFRKYGDHTEATMNWRHSVMVGLGQAAAVTPGMSRSGVTLVVALWCGLKRETAVRYSFLLAIPVILGSSILALPKIDAGLIEEMGRGPLLLSFIVTFFCSIVGIVWLIEFLKRSKLIYFAAYCFLLAAFVFFYFDAAVVFDVG